MPKRKINLTMGQDLIDYAKAYAARQRTTVSEVFTQFILNLKRVNEDDPMKIFLDDPGFRDSLLATMVKIQTGRTKWSQNDKEILRNDYSDRICLQPLSDLELLPEYTLQRQ